jgi:hypothetical protein
MLVGKKTTPGGAWDVIPRYNCYLTAGNEDTASKSRTRCIQNHHVNFFQQNIYTCIFISETRICMNRAHGNQKNHKTDEFCIILIFQQLSRSMLTSSYPRTCGRLRLFQTTEDCDTDALVAFGFIIITL